ncbi:5-oxoprolinase subunit PxpB [Planococcus sp. ISL-109]|uniref:5-oxoprolinase subunit PxpB n=1 Tax=Planococcus sp. ISL-109 TaxID=2819166 RepID=UPI001BEA485F|nr:5-oxoprolinase subunit PxpB [Planococcus sp. ISL-109]MBT2581518.1 5-oxoprolinase subunit PxpB [Planococcus sp. ISL-109]
MEFTFSPLSEQALVIETGSIINKETEQAVRKLSSLLENQAPDWLIEFIPAFTTVTVFYDPCRLKQQQVEQELRLMLADLDEVEAPAPRHIEIPVCYGGTFGPDLGFVAEHNGLTEEEVIEIHTSGTYSVHMIGFAPGFPFIGGMSEKIAAPRRKSPRLRIPERTVGIAGMQTGVYPIETPGGWQLIGRTPLRLFLPDQDIPSLLRAGDEIRFTQIDEAEYREQEAIFDAKHS